MSFSLNCLLHYWRDSLTVKLPLSPNSISFAFYILRLLIWGECIYNFSIFLIFLTHWPLDITPFVDSTILILKFILLTIRIIVVSAFMACCSSILLPLTDLCLWIQCMYSKNRISYLFFQPYNLCLWLVKCLGHSHLVCDCITPYL